MLSRSGRQMGVRPGACVVCVRLLTSNVFMTVKSEYAWNHRPRNCVVLNDGMTGSCEPLTNPCRRKLLHAISATRTEERKMRMAAGGDSGRASGEWRGDLREKERHEGDMEGNEMSNRKSVMVRVSEREETERERERVIQRRSPRLPVGSSAVHSFRVFLPSPPLLSSSCHRKESIKVEWLSGRLGKCSARSARPTRRAGGKSADQANFSRTRDC